MVWLKSVLLLPILLICVNSCDISLTTVSGTHARQPVCKGALIFEDNFDELDLKKWQHELTLGGGGNWEFQWYNNNRTNSYVDKGILHIKPTLLADQFGEKFLYSGTLDINGGSPSEACTNPQWYGCIRTGTSEHVLNPIKSARIRTVESFSFKYGKVEVRARAPTGDWLWPAIWMLPRYNQYSTWPASGEIDIMEVRGNKNLLNAAGENIGVKQTASTLHWGPNPDYNRFPLTHYEKNSKTGYNNEYHRFQLEWTPEHMIFSVDDEEIGRVTPPEGGFWKLGKLDATRLENPWKRNSKMAPFDQEFYLIINLAVGGVNFFPDPPTANNRPKQKPWKNNSPAAATDFWKAKDDWLPTWDTNTENSHFRIDYVKVWAL